ncbi:MAG TPA: hypothetical protein VFE78_34260 [Gemmataceae bacterium]|nr:hypothetical protein [Gemmataceae bacterium]
MTSNSPPTQSTSTPRSSNTRRDSSPTTSFIQRTVAAGLSFSL